MSSSAAAAVSIGTQVLGNIHSAINNYDELKQLEKVNKYNARVVEERKKALNYEEAMNMTLRRLNAYSEIGSGKTRMAGRGNIGTSADSATMNAYLNLAGDLSAMSFNYENKRVDLETEKRNYLYQANVAKAQKKSAIWGGILGTSGAVAGGIARGYSSGLFGSSSKTSNETTN